MVYGLSSIDQLRFTQLELVLEQANGKPLFNINILIRTYFYDRFLHASRRSEGRQG